MDLNDHTLTSGASLNVAGAVVSCQELQLSASELIGVVFSRISCTPNLDQF